MSIVKSLEQNVNRLEELLRRNNGDLQEAAPAIFQDMRGDIDALRGLETVAPINAELVSAFQEKGEQHVAANR